MTDSTNHYTLSADRPISSRTEDDLGRKDFSISLANNIRSWKNKDSLVIGLYGSWGSGKTSVKNMVLENLRESDEHLEVIEFNPWQLADRDRLNSAFFLEIGILLGRSDSGNEDRKAYSKFISYAAYLKAGAYLFQGTRRFTIWLVRFALAAAVCFDLLIEFVSMGLDEPWIRWLVGIALLIIIISENIAGWLSGLFEHFAAIQAAKVQNKEKGLDERKKEISTLLEKMKSPILIVIDDVDRLTNEEIRHLFQLIKANADFPNLIYLILCDREVVEESLDQLIPGRGKEFLKKIIQVPLNIPQIKREKLDEFIFTELGKVMAYFGVTEQFLNDFRWNDIFTYGMKPYFLTIRDVNRYINSLSFHLSQFVNEKALEVNSVDLIALETIRVFEGAVYRQLYAGKLLLTNFYVPQFKEESDQLFKKSIFDTANSKLQVKVLLEKLFPIVKWEKEPLMGQEEMNELLRTLRVGHPDMFHRYFHFAIPEDEISQDDVERVISHSGDQRSLLNDFRTYKQRGLLDELLERLTVNLDKVNPMHSILFISVLFDVGDEWEEGEDYEPLPPFFSYFYRISSSLLTREINLRSRHELLKSAIERSKAVAFTSFLVSNDLRGPGGGGEELEQLKEVCIVRIREALYEGRLRKHPHRGDLITLWRDWTSIEEVKQWVVKEVEARDGLFSFVSAYCGISSTGQKTSKYIDHSTLEKFIPIHELERKLREIPIDDLSDNERAVIIMFHQGRNAETINSETGFL